MLKKLSILAISVAALTTTLSGCVVAPARPAGAYDKDRDGVPNRYDKDRDGDGVRNRNDNRPNSPYKY